MDINQFNELFQQRMAAIKAFAEGDKIKDIAGTEAINHFRSSFDNEGFTDSTLEPWKDVARRDPASPWYGHNGFSTEKPAKKIKKGDTELVGNFSQARTTAKILTGGTSRLREGLFYKYIDTGVRITSPTGYGRVHQFGLPAKIYGKATFQMTPRPFMGRSVLLTKNIKKEINDEFIKILKGQ